MSLFDHEARQFKFDVLKEVSKRAFEGKLNEDVCDEVANLLIPGKHADFRCCIYKEKEIIRERTRMAMGKPPVPVENNNERQIVRVLEAACDGCSIHKIQVTDNCRKCMAKACLSACKFDAIKMGNDRAFIDYDKCKECGACKNACPFNAIVETQRPCMKSCPVDAISMDEHNYAVIDEEKCINCGACQAKCPFGAIEDMSWMVPVIDELNKGTKMYAIFAPAIQGQFDNATLPQIMESIRMLGFEEVYEAAIGADAVAWYEKQDAIAHKKEGKKITTSCCPAFVNMAKQHFPTVYEANVSHMVSPMVAITRYLKHNHPEAKVVFIGPCVAKKQETLDTEVDYCLTFEELGAMFVSKNISAENVTPRESDTASLYARNFSIGGGVSKAVAQAAGECGDEETLVAQYADGSLECKKALLMMKVNRFNADILEGMACTGGCICGPATIESAPKAKARMAKENVAIKDKTIASTLETFDFSDIDLHR
ncbi:MULTISPECIES: 4Fe-4S dicluster domain-containing protein [Bacillota]|jgi:ferredoxin hydrogenase large subunit|uniref:4Fe-4S dicluster domain-containing protein n=2 Tax=Amedibacillus TaxID=2749846 RepID=A0A7G9GMP9_9FIRM|nr:MULTISPECIES: 4Fe-4S dicluster domain-containing protein [Bacillota]QNM12081.1 4Fe-4S dicluster domain-containing protein [[Eubacterium] hominis]MCH4286566.1 4Fe-4S dicluster domain-containing protein [Amedibacillus hominis]RGB53147.1 4Fe-4S dicluster domain-containing protein [Absiella sp. AM22-9]RGB59437.1 4Fe-4S dicluster domain-containing protein [Absiella sp. AM10-20]RGB66590.1 4Fe-4S dicluster domain-containing protein [Absiella sp. AM09-45]